MRKTYLVIVALLAAFVISDARALAAAKQNEPTKLELGGAEYYLKQYEDEVRAQRGGTQPVYRNQREALTRIQALVQKYPDHPKVKELYERAQAALIASKGDMIKITPEMTKYKRDEAELIALMSELAQKDWDALTASGDAITKLWPAPDPMDDASDIASLEGRMIVLDEVIYPRDQFIGGSGEYIKVGKPSSGFYYVALSGRNWLGPYEAVKRYRRQVDATLPDDLTFTVLGRISGPVMEIPQAGEEKTMNFYWGWVVVPEYLYIPGHVLARYDKDHESSGVFIGEPRVEAIKNGWYTVTSIPDDVTPERLMEIFMTAIKEKNYPLYEQCIDPERQATGAGRERLRYHWDLHQARFADQYVHATFDPAKIEVQKGFDDRSENIENFFLDDETKKKMIETQGEKVETARVDSRAYDANGKQVGSPHPHGLIRRNNGRWYVDDYTARF